MPHDAETVNNHTSEASPTSTCGSATCCQSFDDSRHFAFQRCSSRWAGSHQAATQQNGTVGGTKGADRRSRRAPLRGWFAWEDFELVCSVTAGNWLAAPLNGPSAESRTPMWWSACSAWSRHQRLIPVEPSRCRNSQDLHSASSRLIASSCFHQDGHQVRSVPLRLRRLSGAAFLGRSSPDLGTPTLVPVLVQLLRVPGFVRFGGNFGVVVLSAQVFITCCTATGCCSVTHGFTVSVAAVVAAGRLEGMGQRSYSQSSSRVCTGIG